MTDQPAPEGTGTPGSDMPSADMPSTDMPSTEPAPAEMAAAAPPPPAEMPAATPPPMPPPAPMAPPPPPVAPPPAVAWQAPPPAPVMQGRRTVLATIAGVGLLVLGILGMILGVLALAGTALVGSLQSQLGDVPGLPAGTNAADVLAGVFVFLGVIVIAYSLVYIIGAIGVLRFKGWGRVMGIIVGVLSGLFWLLGLTGSANSSSGGLFVIVLVVVHVYIVISLLFFWRTKATA